MTRLGKTITILAIGISSAAGAQSFDGATLNYQYYYDTPYADASNGSFAVGPEVEVPNVADGVATLDVSGSNISFTDNSITVDWRGLSFTDATVVSLNVSFGGAAVPEPSTWVLLLSGFALTGVALRRRRRTGQAALA